MSKYNKSESMLWVVYGEVSAKYTNSSSSVETEGWEIAIKINIKFVS
jgi:hypothetical protein